MKTRKRKSAALTKTRKSKRLEKSTDVPMSSQCMDPVNNTCKRKIEALSETGKSRYFQVSSDESNDSRNSLEKNIVEGVKMSAEHLGTYAKRAVICERVVAVWELKDSQISNVVEKCNLEPICKIKGRANMSLVREFFAGIDRSTVDIAKESLVTVVRGTTIVITPDALAKSFNFDRPLPDEPQYPYRKGDKKPDWNEIWPTLLRKGGEVDDRGFIFVRDLTRDFVFLHHFFWWNVNPKRPHRSVTFDQARMLFEVYNGRKPDLAILWFLCVYAAYLNESSVASLPLGVSLTNMMVNEYKVPIDPNDDWDVQKKPLGRATLGKSEGQSKLHRVRKTPDLSTVEGNNDLLLSLHENLSNAYDMLVAIDKRQARMEKRQLKIVETVTRIEKRLTMGKGEGVESDNVVEDYRSEGEDEDEDESEGDANHEVVWSVGFVRFVGFWLTGPTKHIMDQKPKNTNLLSTI